MKKKFIKLTLLLVLVGCNYIVESDGFTSVYESNYYINTNIDFEKKPNENQKFILTTYTDKWIHSPTSRKINLIDILSGTTHFTIDFAETGKFIMHFEQLESGRNVVILNNLYWWDIPDYTIFVLDKNLNILKEYNVTNDQLWAFRNRGFVREENEEIYLYFLYSFTENSMDLMKYSIFNDELILLKSFERNYFSVYQTNDYNLFLLAYRESDFNSGIINSNFTFFNLMDNSIQSFTFSNYSYRNIELNNDLLLINENRNQGPSPLNQLILFDLATFNYKIIQLLDYESIDATFSHSSHDIVTINRYKNKFKKYDFQGYLLFEQELIFPSKFENIEFLDILISFEIYSNSENIYTVHTTVHGQIERFIQTIHLTK